MESLVSTFHLDLKLFIAQAINFAIVLAVLYYFAFKPIAKVMEERSQKIEKSLDDAKAIEAKLSDAETEKKEIITEAKKAATEILEKANEQGELRQKEMVAKAREDIGQIINAEKAKMQVEKAETLKALKAETAELVVLTVEKLLKEKMNSEKDQELIKKLVK
ncbi:MAG: F0F1 ATP synthase subunit B [Candidatus Falkowbacteria bacterium]|nr:F0F1 ATP synthase subunit B [Candidatus Falkowbacteria bacterium]